MKARPTKSAPVRGRLIIHGHFYQPPRENPWLRIIERQRSAAPARHWNERVLEECYRPNTRSRILDGGGRIRRIVNNFESISFNFGPTLLQYIQDADPETYRLILDADKRSADRRGGHGNAIAQGYNHVILPLADRRERRVQIRWGLEDFRLRFGRDAEGFWLPETAIHEETARQLVEEGVRFVVLSPDQAEASRPFGAEEWADTAAEPLDTARPYRLYPFDGDGRRHLDIFFYHRQLSVAISFEHLLRDAGRFAARLAEAAGDDEGDREGRLVHVASDGEIYGHHEPFADMCLAALYDRALHGHGLVPTNYGEYLDRFPPAHEVRLAKGENGEGTAWSCSHGVGRWVRDCGCRAGQGGRWNQKWRTPLRHALRELSDDLDAIWEVESARLFRRRDAARDDCARLLAGNDSAAWRAFLGAHLKPGFDPAGEEARDAFDLVALLVDRHRMFTSCAWFFDDISGLEASQNLLYAAHAIEMARRFDEERAVRAEERFCETLAGAGSNLASQGDGAKIFARRRREAARTEREWFAGWAICRMLGGELPDELAGGRAVRLDRSEREEAGDRIALRGRAVVSGPLGARKTDCRFYAAADGEHRFRAWVTEEELPDGLDIGRHSIPALDRRVSLRAVRRDGLPGELGRLIVGMVIDRCERRRLTGGSDDLDEMERLERLARAGEVEPPQWLESAVARRRALRFLDLVSSLLLQLVEGKEVLPLLKEARTLHRWGRRHGVDLASGELRLQLDKAIHTLLDEDRLERVHRMLTVASRLGVEPLDPTAVQNRFHERIRRAERPDRTLRKLALRLNFSPEIFDPPTGEEIAPAGEEEEGRRAPAGAAPDLVEDPF